MLTFAGTLVIATEPPSDLELSYVSPGAGESSDYNAQLVVELNELMATKVEHYEDLLKEYREINPDVTGWIEIPGFNISYPVLYSSDNKQYLRTDIYGKYSVAGCIYVDANYGNIYSPVKLIHGHNMNDGSMFAALPSLLEETTLDHAPTIYYYDDLGLKVYKIFSVFSVDGRTESVIVKQDPSLEELEDLKKEYKSRSWVPCTLDTTGGELLMLNTCWYGESGVEHYLHCITVAIRVGEESVQNEIYSPRVPEEG